MKQTKKRGPKVSIVCNGDTLRRVRGEAGLTQEELAHEAGISVDGVRRAEKGDPIEVRTARKLAAVLKIAVEALESSRCHPESDVDLAFQTPSLSWDPLRSPGALLRADVAGGVPFHGRSGEIAHLLDWCGKDTHIAVQLITGEGGMGKTRLAIELCSRLPKGWRAGFISETVRDDCAELANDLFDDPRPKLVVLDYAETRLEVTRQFIAAAVRSRSAAPIRVALIARRKSDWWVDLASTGGGVDALIQGAATLLMPLLPLASTPKERSDAFTVAGSALAKRLGLGFANKPPDMRAPSYQRVLLIHMAALAQVLGFDSDGANAVLSFVLLRERRYLERLLTEKGIPKRLLGPLVTATAGVFWLKGIASEDECIRFLQLVPGLHGLSHPDLYALTDLLHNAYQGPKWINQLQPDLLGEHLLAAEEKRRPESIQGLAKAFESQGV